MHIIRLPLNVLTIHPALDGMHEWPEDDPQWGPFCADIAERGFDFPIKVDQRNRIVDGRHRFKGAQRLKLEDIPTDIVSDEEVQAIILQSLLQRRHYTKSARAYIVYPHFADAHKEARARRQSNLRNSKQAQEGKRLEDFVRDLGFSVDLFAQAAKVHEIFAADAEFKAESEPKVLDGSVALGAVIAGYAGREATKGKEKNSPHAVLLFARTFDDIGKRTHLWEKLNEAERTQATTRISAACESMPDDLLEVVGKRLQAESKRRKEERI